MTKSSIILNTLNLCWVMRCLFIDAVSPRSGWVNTSQSDNFQTCVHYQCSHRNIANFKNRNYVCLGIHSCLSWFLKCHRQCQDTHQPGSVCQACTLLENGATQGGVAVRFGVSQRCIRNVWRLRELSEKTWIRACTCKEYWFQGWQISHYFGSSKSVYTCPCPEKWVPSCHQDPFELV